jgi:hypothetical protein
MRPSKTRYECFIAYDLIEAVSCGKINIQQLPQYRLVIELSNEQLDLHLPVELRWMDEKS